jgi:hypothetical protein
VEDSSVLQISKVEVGATCVWDGAHTPSKQGLWTAPLGGFFDSSTGCAAHHSQLCARYVLLICCVADGYRSRVDMWQHFMIPASRLGGWSLDYVCEWKHFGRALEIDAIRAHEQGKPFKLLDLLRPMADPDVGVIQLATVNNSRGLSTTHADCQQLTRTAMRGGEGALHCCRAGTGSSNAQACTGQETETRTCQEREKGQEVSADASQAAEEGETIIDGRIISCSPIALTRCVWQVGEYTAAVNCIISCVSQLEKHLMAVNI